jgi:cytochrome c
MRRVQQSQFNQGACRLALAIALPLALAACTGGEDAKLAAKGKELFEANCSICHSVDPSVHGKTGPNLSAFFGKKPGGREDFPYSYAIRTASFVWDAETLDRFLTDPQGFLPGNKMGFFGLTDAAERQALIAYLSKAGRRGQ